MALSPEFGWAGLWQSGFHSISAFNNADVCPGYPDSLSAMGRGNPIVNLVIPALSFFGGLGFYRGRRRG